ncbi:hypothetical protein [Patulibacter sp.]|uniref:hypothetical protein n=1 Tax=Patulibacter sp. TaxID=1912859 RepID=UPI00271D7860|nr:hypothetical protein [Patulibacter sp.]MDO9406811.1 hypothetical protein [Patulibacter sp.]
MPIDRDQPWWADAQEYRHRDPRRRPSADGASRTEDEYSAGAARRRRAAAARASAQERRARQRRPEPEEFGWVDESPFAPSERERDRERDSHRRARERSRQPGPQRSADRPGSGVARRPGARPPVRRRRANGILARPEKLLLYAALLGLFLVLAAVSNSDAAVVVHHVAPPR